MRQILHIFRKDTRMYWLEILTSLVVLSLDAFLAPSRWNYSETAMRNQAMNVLLPVLLLPATWWLLIARVIHAESLVGDRQWWLTRPYEWKKLLAAKALFILTWIYVPFAIAQAAIVKEAGLSPFMQSAAWLSMLAFVSGYVLLPLVAIATITANFARMTLTLFGVIVVWIGAFFLASMPREGYESSVPYGHGMWIIFILTAGAAAVVLLQFATRRVWFARAIVAVTIVLATGTGMLLTAKHESEIDQEYPASAVAPVQFAFAPETDPVKTEFSERPSKVYIDVPMLFSGVAEGAAAQVDDVKITLDDPVSGKHWTTPWWTSRAIRFLPGRHQQQLQMMLDRDQYERFKSAPVTLHLALAVTELRAGSETTAAISSGDFVVEGFGVCTGRWLYRFPTQPMCRSALAPPTLTLLSTAWTRTQQPNAYVPPGPITATAWSDTPQSLVFPIFPVLLAHVNLYPFSIYGPLSSMRGVELAPGTPVHFVQYAVSGRTQVSLTIPNFHLPEESR